MKIEIFKGNWTLDDVKNNPNKIFVFGDNNARIGKGGQAIIRDLPNAMGLRTKKGPSTKPAAYYKDSEFDQNSKNILEDILDIKKEAMDGMTLVFSEGGYGTGLASLKSKSPKTFEYLCQQLRDHFSFNNETGKMWYKLPGHDEIVSGAYIDFDKSSILKPTNNSFFKPEYLEKRLNNNYDLIKNDKKIAFSSNLKFKNGEVIIFTFTGISEYLVCRVIDSYDIQMVLDDYKWYSFEGYDKSFDISGPDTLNSYKYQTHFQFVCTLDTSGKMVFREDAFTDKKKVSSFKKPIEELVTEKESVDIPKVDEKVDIVVDDDKKQDIDMNNNDEILEILKRIEAKLDKKRFNFKNPFRKKTLNELITKKIGDFSELRKIEETNKYQLKVCGTRRDLFPNAPSQFDIYYYIVFNEGIFINSIDILFKTDKPLY